MHGLIGFVVFVWFMWWLSKHPGVLLHLIVFGAVGILFLISGAEKQKEDHVKAVVQMMGPARIIQKDADSYTEITDKGECIVHSREAVVGCYRPERYAKWPAIGEPVKQTFKVLEAPVVIQRHNNVRKVY